MATSISNPRSTGGAGVRFEQHVGAMFLALLLTRGIPAVFTNCQVEKISFQTSHCGWGTDDLLVDCSSTNYQRHKLAIQIKYSFRVGLGSEACVKTFQGFWRDFNATDRFNPDRDALVLATLRSSQGLYGLDSLLYCARSSADAEDFKKRLKIPGFVSAKAGDYYDVIWSIVEKDGPPGLDREKFWRFLRTIHVLFLDFTSSTAYQEAMTTQMLAQSSGDPGALDAARDTWYKLVNIAADAASAARTIRYLDLPGDMREKYNAITAPLLQALMDHSNITLGDIRSTIAGKITLPRTETVAEAVTALTTHQVVVLSGPPGSGKSVLAKEVVRQHSANHLCWSFRAEEFAESHIDHVLPDSISGRQLEDLVVAQERVLVHVESLERLLEHDSHSAFYDLVGIVGRCPNVSLLLTCREHAVETALTAFFGRSPLAHIAVSVPPLSREETGQVRNDVPRLGALLSQPGLGQILSVPYFLDMAASMDWSDSQNIPSNMKAFREKCWRDNIRNNGKAVSGLPDRRERALIDLAMRRARELRPYVTIDGADAEALGALHRDGIIVRKDGLAAPAHDIVEDWAIIHWAESLATKHEWQPAPIAEAIGTHPAVRRGFREWLKEGLDANSEPADRFVLSAYNDRSLHNHFRDDVLVSVLLSRSAKNFVLRQRDKVLEDDAHLLVRLIHLTRVACTKAPKLSDGQVTPQSVLLEPEGDVWAALLEVIANNLDHLPLACIGPILGLLEAWTLGVALDTPTPNGAVPAGRIAYRLLEQAEANHDGDVRERVLRVIVRVPGCDRDRFTKLVRQASPGTGPYAASSEEFGKLLMDGISGTSACRDFPVEMAQFTLSLCRLPEQHLGHVGEFSGSPYVEYEFGLNPNISFDFLPNSALQGPFAALLVLHPDVGFDLIMKIVNHAGDWYGNRRWPATSSRPAHFITISVPGHPGIKQCADDRLWQAYRGTSTAPYVIQCALMALERWLLNMCENAVRVEPLLLRILRESNSVMTTAVVASVCNAHPDLGGEAALSLLKSRGCIELDRWRVRQEPALVVASALDPIDRFYRDERMQSNEQPHRRHNLEDLARKLQRAGKKDRVWEAINSHLEGVPSKGQRTDDDMAWLLRLHLMDSRRSEFSYSTSVSAGNGLENGKIAATPDTGKMDSELRHFAKAVAEKELQLATAGSLWNWGRNRWTGRSESEGAESWQSVLALAKNARRRNASPYLARPLEAGPSIVAAVCVRDHWEDVAGDDRRWCINTLIADVERNEEGGYHAGPISLDPTSLDGHAAYVLPRVLACDPDNVNVLRAVARAITHPSSQVSLMASMGVAEYLKVEHQPLALRCAGTVAMRSNISAHNQQPQVWNAMDLFPGERSNPQYRRQIQDAFVQGSVNADKEISSLDPTLQTGKYALTRILLMLGKAPDLALAEGLHEKVRQAVVDSWAASRRDHNGSQDFAFETSAIRVLADSVLGAPFDKALPYYQPFLDAVGEHPDEVAYFIEMLIAHEDGRDHETCFWDVWQVFADRVLDAPWSSKVHFSRSTGAKLVDKMLLGISWKDDQQSWSHLAGHEYRINKLVGSLPATVRVLESFAKYLYGPGGSSLPDAFKVVGDLLRAGNPANLLSSKNTIFLLESSLQRHIYGRPEHLKTDSNLRTNVLMILNHLVEAGSSAAYKMRDYFVTPGAG